MFKSGIRRLFSSYDPLNHSLLGSILCFEVKELNKMSYGIVMEHSKELILIDPNEENIPDYAILMDEKELKLRSAIITGDLEQFDNFYSDL